MLASSDGGASAFAAVDFSRCLAHLGLRVGNFFLERFECWILRLVSMLSEF